MNTYYVIVPKDTNGKNTLNLHKGDGQIYFDSHTAETHRERLLNPSSMEVRCVQIIAKEESGK